MNNEWQTMDNAPKDRLITIWAQEQPWTVEWSRNIVTGDEAWRLVQIGENHAVILPPHEAMAWQEAPTKPEWLTD
jgi:hypothetical protein